MSFQPNMQCDEMGDLSHGNDTMFRIEIPKDI